MTKEMYLNTLDRLLKSMAGSERSKMLTYYSEMIDDRMEEGMTEEEAIHDMGSVGHLAQQILEQQPSTKKELSTSAKVLIVILLVLGCPLWACILLMILCLGLTGILLILTGYILIWLIPVLSAMFMVAALVVCVFSMIGAPFLFSSNSMLGVLQLGIGLMAGGLGVLLGVLTLYISKLFVKTTVWFNNWLKKNVFNRLKGVHIWKS